MPEPSIAWQLLESNFMTALVGSLAGAFFGAYAAQRISERAKLREQLSSEIGSLNAATSIAFGIANSAMTAKKQQIQPFFTSYQADLENHQRWLTEWRDGLPPEGRPFELKMNLQTIPRLRSPIKPLQDLVFGKIPGTSLIVNLTLSLTEYLELLEIAMDARDRQIADFRAGRLPPGATVHDLYLGLTYAGGHRNNEFGGTLSAIASYTDHVIFYASELAVELSAAARKSQGKYRSTFSDSPPKVSEVDFSAAVAADLLPDRSLYDSWLKGFAKKESPAPWWKR
jgi:hypothetical protein